jgi:hypothetical protein
MWLAHTLRRDSDLGVGRPGALGADSSVLVCELAALERGAHELLELRARVGVGQLLERARRAHATRDELLVPLHLVRVGVRVRVRALG